MNLRLPCLFSSAACLVALACGHEAESPRPPPSTSSTTIAIAELPATPTALSPTPTPEPAPSPPASAPRGEICIEVDGDNGGKHITLEGRVVVDNEFEHPSRGKTHPFVLRLDASRCANGIDEPRVTEIALASGDGVQLKPLVGQHVRVSGDPFVAHTAWHARPIVFMTTTVTRLH